MHWTEPATADDSHAALEKKLWDAANMLWAGAELKPSEYSPTVLGLIFLRYADVRFAAVEKELGRDGSPSRPSSRRKIGATDYHAAGVIYLPENAGFAELLSLPEGANTGQSINDAMRAIEKENPDLADVLPKTYHILDSRTLAELLKVMASIPMDKGGDTFGLIYEYFLGKFAMTEGQKGGEFYTPTSIVKLIVEILEPYHGRILDPACGSGGMFIQSARFVEEHRKNPTTDISVHGQERVTDTSRLARLNLAVHGLNGDIKQGNTYYEDLQDSVGRFDFVMANPPFNVSKIDKERLSGDPRYPFGIPRTDNGNYLWIQHFHSALNRTGRAGFVMANSAADARASEQEIREKIIRAGDVDVMVAIGPNFFFTVTLPCTLWFFDKGKSKIQNQQSSIGNRKDTVLFIDARHIFRQLDRAHRDFTPAQLEFLANIVRLYRGESEAVSEFISGKIDSALSALTDICTGDAPHSIPALQSLAVCGTGSKLESQLGEPIALLDHHIVDAIKHWNQCETDAAAVVDYLIHIFTPFADAVGEIRDSMERITKPITQDTSIREMAAALFNSLGEVPALSADLQRFEACFPGLVYRDVPGLCKAATLVEIEAQGWSLNPGRYVGVAKGEDLSDEDFKEQLEALNEELEVLNAEARELEERIAGNVTELLSL